MWLPKPKLEPDGLFGWMSFKVALQLGTGASHCAVAEPRSLDTYAITGGDDGHVQAR